MDRSQERARIDLAPPFFLVGMPDTGVGFLWLRANETGSVWFMSRLEGEGWIAANGKIPAGTSLLQIHDWEALVPWLLRLRSEGCFEVRIYYSDEGCWEIPLESMIKSVTDDAEPLRN